MQDGEHHPVGAGVFVDIGIAVRVDVTGVVMKVGKLVKEGAGLGAVGRAVGWVPQAESNTTRVKKKWACFIVCNYSLV